MIKGVILEDEKVPVSKLQPVPRGKAGRAKQRGQTPFLVPPADTLVQGLSPSQPWG